MNTLGPESNWRVAAPTFYIDGTGLAGLEPASLEMNSVLFHF